MSGTDFTALHHSPLARAAETAQILAKRLPGVPVHEDDLVSDYVPGVPERADTPSIYHPFLDGLTDDERTEGPKLAAAAVDRFFRAPDSEERLLVVTHTFLIGWLVQHAMAAPTWRRMGLNVDNCGLTVLSCKENRPPAVVSFNDVGHLARRSTA